MCMQMRSKSTALMSIVRIHVLKECHRAVHIPVVFHVSKEKVTFYFIILNFHVGNSGAQL